MKRTTLLFLSSMLLLWSCSFSGPSDTTAVTVPPVSGGKSGIFSTEQLGQSRRTVSRPSGTLGVFASMFLAQGTLGGSQAGLQGIDALLGILKEQEEPLNDETFLLLEQLGTALSVDIVDLLNRSTDRAQALTDYANALQAVTENSKRKMEVLTVSSKNLANEKKEQRLVVRDLEREIQTAVNAKDFGTAGGKQAELTKEQTKLSEIELKEKQTNDALRNFKDMTGRADARIAALEVNREILISGLQITDPKGLKDLGILTESKSSSRFLR